MDPNYNQIPQNPQQPNTAATPQPAPATLNPMPVQTPPSPIAQQQPLSSEQPLQSTPQPQPAAMQQPNPQVMPNQPQQPQQAAFQQQSPQPNAGPTTAFAQPLSGNQGNEDAKISNPKYWLTIIGILIAIRLVHFIFGEINLAVLANLIWVVGLVLCFRHVNSLKQKASDTLSKDDKFKSIMIMSVSPIITQAIYYFSLKKLQPQNAGKFNKMGWKIFGILCVAFFILLIITIATIGDIELQQTT